MSLNNLMTRIKLFIASLFCLVFAGAYSSIGATGLRLSIKPPFTNMVGGGMAQGGKKTLGEIILFVLILFIVFLFATSGIIANSNIQTQLKNGAYYGGLFASVVVILIVLGFIL